MKKILIATQKPFNSLAVEGIKKIVENSENELVVLEKYSNKEELLKAVEDVNALIIRSDKITSEVIAAAKNLEIVVRAGAGYDNVDLTAATDNNIIVMNTPGQNSNAVAELALGMMVFAARGFFNGKSGSELSGKKLGIHAFGYVGRLVAKIANGFGMEVYAFDPFIPEDIILNEGATPVKTVEELYKTCQYISLHIPSNDKTKKTVNYNLLANMPEGAVLINTARKEVINEDELIKLMGERADFKFVSDIPPANKDGFAKFEGRCYFSPKKMGAQTVEANVNAGLAAANQIIQYFETGNETFRVN